MNANGAGDLTAENPKAAKTKTRSSFGIEPTQPTIVQAVNEIICANTTLDKINKYSAEDHFDSQMLAAAVAKLDLHYKTITDALTVSTGQ